MSLHGAGFSLLSLPAAALACVLAGRLHAKNEYAFHAYGNFHNMIRNFVFIRNSLPLLQPRSNQIPQHIIRPGIN